jgi:hypothetical protein
MILGPHLFGRFPVDPVPAASLKMWSPVGAFLNQQVAGMRIRVKMAV